MQTGLSFRTGRGSLEPLAGRSPRILIVRLSAIGDCILTMPLATALRDAYPQALIAWAVEGVAGTMVERHPAVDVAIRLPRRFLQSPSAMWQLRSDLQSLKLDVAIDPQGLSKSALVAWLSGAARRIGFARPIGREVSPWLNTELIDSRERHVVDRYRELLQPLAIQPGPVRFDFPHDEQADAKMRVALGQLGVPSRFAVLNPGAGWESKLWPADRFAALAAELNRRWHVCSLVVWAGERERAWSEQIAAQSGGAAVAAPATTLLELAAILRRCSLFVGSDTGPLHMAAAIGTPCVGLYGPTRPQDCGPYGSGHQTIQATYQGGTSRQRRGSSNWAMQQISTQRVVDACDVALSGLPAGSAA